MADTTQSTAINVAELIAELTPLALELALKLQAVLSNYNAGNTTALTTDALTSDNEVLNKVNAWLTSKGLPTT